MSSQRSESKGLSAKETKERLRVESKLRTSDGRPSSSSSSTGSSNYESLSTPTNVTASEDDVIESKLRRERLRNREWKLAVSSGDAGEIVPPTSEKGRRVMDGFRIDRMQMKDADGGRVMWEARDWGKETFGCETTAEIPSEILKCRAVSREIIFYSKESIEDFRLEQRIFLHGRCIENWTFDFGFVIPNSTNTWEQTIVAAPKSQMIPAEVLNGNVTIETSFIDGEEIVSKTLLRIFYV
eukprot:g1012.t1